MKPKRNIEVVVRAVIVHRGKVLLCRLKGPGHHFFPGGHMETGETVEHALRREFREELGMVPKKISFIGAVENEYVHRKDGPIHEINLVFHVVVDKLHTESREDHIDFALMTPREFSRVKVLPILLSRAVRKWLRDRTPFWVSSMR